MTADPQIGSELSNLWSTSDDKHYAWCQVERFLVVVALIVQRERVAEEQYIWNKMLIFRISLLSQQFSNFWLRFPLFNFPFICEKQFSKPCFHWTLSECHYFTAEEHPSLFFLFMTQMRRKNVYTRERWMSRWQLIICWQNWKTSHIRSAKEIIILYKMFSWFFYFFLLTYSFCLFASKKLEKYWTYQMFAVHSVVLSNFVSCLFPSYFFCILTQDVPFY